MSFLSSLKTTTAAGLIAASFLAPQMAEASPPSSAEIAKTYADIAHAMYEDSLNAALILQEKVNALLANPTAQTLAAARSAWIDARVPYQQTEGYRFGNAIVDEWEGKVNAWPLDEGLIDYVDPSYGNTSDENPAYTLNVVANPTFQLGAQSIDAKVISKDLLADQLHEAQGVEANVATGYHAVEFMLWGQDLNGTNAGAGNRPASDFDTKNCTNGSCDRRGAYLKAATELLIDDLKDILAAWDHNGNARQAVLAKSEKDVLTTILTGLGSLSYGELAGERIKLGVLLNDPEEEHDCFSDNTHNSHFYNQVGMNAIYSGRYTRSDGSVLFGASLADYVEDKAPEIHTRVMQTMKTTDAKMSVMKETADSGRMAYDQMLGAGNTEGNKILLDVVDGLVGQARAFEQVISKLNLSVEIEGSDSLDNPNAI